jgi:hypothetical protein
VRLTGEQFGDGPTRQQLNQAHPASRFAHIVPEVRLQRGTYYLYVSGQAALLLAGSGAFIGLFRLLARRTRIPILAPALQEMQQRPNLVWAMHLTYFGLVIVVALLMYEVPDVPTVLRAVARAQIRSSAGPLGIAGNAYASGSVARAAAVTFLINFLLGSLAMITLPSVIVPASGTLIAALRAIMWGCALAPTTVAMSASMRTHSWTLLFEGEGYILATFFAVLIPICLFQVSPGGNVRGRFGRVLALNIKANVLVALVLALAACYEAIEVIWL